MQERISQFARKSAKVFTRYPIMFVDRVSAMVDASISWTFERDTQRALIATAALPVFIIYVSGLLQWYANVPGKP